MIKRYSSKSKVFSVRNFGKDTMLSWQEFHNFFGYNKMALIGLHIFPFPKSPEPLLIHLSTNLVSSTMSNPNGTILSFSPGKMTKIFIKGKYQITLDYIRLSFSSEFHSLDREITDTVNFCIQNLLFDAETEVEIIVEFANETEKI